MLSYESIIYHGNLNLIKLDELNVKILTEKKHIKAKACLKKVNLKKNLERNKTVTFDEPITERIESKTSVKPHCKK